MEMVSGLADALRGVPAHDRAPVRRQLRQTRSDADALKKKPAMRYVGSLSVCNRHSPP